MSGCNRPAGHFTQGNVTQVIGTWCGFGEVAVVCEWNPISAGVLRPLLLLSSSLS